LATVTTDEEISEVITSRFNIIMSGFGTFQHALRYPVVEDA
jgi:nucleoid DNA-binding protein